MRQKAGPSGLILHDEGAVYRAPGPPGRPRQWRRRPGTGGYIRGCPMAGKGIRPALARPRRGLKATFGLP